MSGDIKLAVPLLVLSVVMGLLVVTNRRKSFLNEVRSRPGGIIFERAEKLDCWWLCRGNR